MELWQRAGRRILRRVIAVVAGAAAAGMLVLLGMGAGRPFTAEAAAGAAPDGRGAPVALSLLGEDRAAFAVTSSSPEFARLGALPRLSTMIPAPDDGTADDGNRAALSALAAEDTRTRAQVASAREQTITDLLVTDVGGVIDLSQIHRVRVGRRTKEWRCLTEALYFEARGEDLLGQAAVAEVILNRVDDPRFPDTVCGVVRQGSGKRGQCQFSYWCDGRAERITEPKAFEELGKLAWVMLQGKPRILTGKATYYHAVQVRPRWARAMVRTGRIGNHIFYRQPLRLSRR